MNTQEYIQSLFSGYEETGNVKDFMEELQSNLDARIASLVRKGLPENEAFDKACAELGDISVLADELSLKKRQEVFEDAYMDIKKYINPRRMAAYVIFGIIVLFGIIVAIISFYASSWANQTTAWFHHNGWYGSWHGGRLFDRGLGIVVFTGVLLPFLVTAIAGFTFLGLTQETKSHYPMSKKRAVWYTVAAAMISFGLIIMLLAFFTVGMAATSYGIIAAVSILIPFVLPGAGLLTYLVLTEKDRHKPWMASILKDAENNEMKLWNDPVIASRFGMYSGAIWIFAAALFILFGFLLGFRYSWLVFIFAVGIQMLVQGFMIKRK